MGCRLLQIVFYFYMYFRWLDAEGVEQGTPLHAVVPTGNFGNVLAGFYAKRAFVSRVYVRVCARVCVRVRACVCARACHHVLACPSLLFPLLFASHYVLCPVACRHGLATGEARGCHQQERHPVPLSPASRLLCQARPALAWCVCV